MQAPKALGNAAQPLAADASLKRAIGPKLVALGPFAQPGSAGEPYCERGRGRLPTAPHQ
jgi:hypothetical protein